jgi:hypothetical protein
MAAKFKRSGLHRLNCPACSGYTYSTVASLETVGFPRCACGEQFEPERVELALLLGRDDLPVVRALFDRTENKEDSQLRSVGRRGVEARLRAGVLNNMSVRALDEIRAEQAGIARRRRLAALVPAPEPMPF